MATTSDKARTSANSSGTASSGGGTGGDGGGSGALSGVRQSAADAYQAARDRTAAAYSTARETAVSAGRRTAEGIDTNPMAAVVGGLALGAIVGVLMPLSRQERQLFGSTGQRLTDTAREALIAARDAGKEQLDGFTDQALDAVKASANAAAGKVKGKGER